MAVSAVESSKRMLEETLQAGAATLQELGSQRETLKVGFPLKDQAPLL